MMDKGYPQGELEKFKGEVRDITVEDLQALGEPTN